MKKAPPERGFFPSGVVVHDDDPFRADEGGSRLIELEIGELFRFALPGELAEEPVVEGLGDDRRVILIAELIVRVPPGGKGPREVREFPAEERLVFGAAALLRRTSLAADPPAEQALELGADPLPLLLVEERAGEIAAPAAADGCQEHHKNC